ncbi:ABC transporter substrate-binding protein [Rubrobacter taiwanensis]|jgi:1,4-dihydroxy-6-naphthoate synthase|uniref:1,4-dihydroxy-6-naphtoate synthase n=1 Tax=Rubrobacter taiwanensis TaxID=185139 RepID=A0A4R1BS66_9ACTN|nr:MqnA/MqnD/SBP family protein [Rubrobacter taiwanensis]TCJ20217.1 ABC transporter substrate-binding protein [Rubrobacter taiwanensis]
MAERTDVRTIRVGHSPDSDDAFMFYALAKDKLDTGNLRFEHELSDIESLNRRAMRGELEVTAISIHAYAYLHDRYALLNSGSSMGDRYGPRIVARESLGRDGLRGRKVAVPGEWTTAFLALRLYQPDVEHEVVPFDEIMDHVIEGRADAGLLIHEGQITHEDKGLVLVRDLGEWWYGETGLPLPLGGNAVRRDLGEETIRQIARLLRESIRYALENRQEALAYALDYARDLPPELADKFVSMYVNEWTLDYGETGRRAVRTLLYRGYEAGVIPHRVEVEFVG